MDGWFSTPHSVLHLKVNCRGKLMICFAHTGTCCVCWCPFARKKTEIQMCVSSTTHTEGQCCLKPIIKADMARRHSGVPVWKYNQQVHSLLFWLLGTSIKPLNTNKQVLRLPARPWQPPTLWFPARSGLLSVFHHHSAQNNSLAC